MVNLNNIESIKNMTYGEIEAFLSENKNDRNAIVEFFRRYMDRKPEYTGTSLEKESTGRDELVRSYILINNILDLPWDNMEFVREVFEKFGMEGFYNIENDMFSKQAIEILGHDNAYDLIKYYKVPGASIILGNVLQNREAFDKYQQFRHDNNVFVEQQMQVMDVYSSIQEFNKDNELITDCMEGELSEEQKKLLISYLREKLPQEELKGRQLEIAEMSSEDARTYLFNKIKDGWFNGFYRQHFQTMGQLKAFETKMQQMSSEEAVKYIFEEIYNEKLVTLIKNKEDLIKFPKVRQERISQMIESGNKDAVTLLLAGVGVQEYQARMQFLNPEQLDGVVSDFGDENGEFSKMQAANKLIELLLSMDEEKRKEVLRSINSDLAKEFTPEGSEIAGMRQAFEGAEISLRKLYGQELSQSLATANLPQAEKDEATGVDVIRLEGQDFKLVVHGIDVFAPGTGKFEKRELGQSYLSASLISEKSIKYIGAVNSPNQARGCFYGFNDIGANALLWSGDGDMGTRSKILGNNSLELQTTRQVAMSKTEQLLEDTTNNKSAEKYNDGYLRDHNEVAFYRESVDKNGNKKVITPNFIVSFSSRGGITKRDIEEAKRLQIPIVFIDEEKYKERSQDKTTEVTHEEETSGKKITARDVYLETLADICEISPALKQEQGMQEIVEAMNKTREVAYERR